MSSAQRQAISQNGENVVISDTFTSYVGPAENLPYFQSALSVIRNCVKDWRSSEGWVLAFIFWSNNPKRRSKRVFEALAYQFKNGFSLFVEDSGICGRDLNEFGSSEINSFLVWLRSRKSNNKGRCSVISVNTQRRLYGAARAMFEELQRNPKTKHLVGPDISFPKHPFPKAHHATAATDVVDDVTWMRMVVACRKEVDETMLAVRAGWNILEGPAKQPDPTRRGQGQYSEFSVALQALASTYPGPVPALSEIRRSYPVLADAVQYIHRLENLVKPLYPDADILLPFILLTAIYTQANTGPLRALRIHQLGISEILGRERIVFNFEKPRSGIQYSRSFAIDDGDQYSPLQLLRFVAKWTQRIRPYAAGYADSVFIFVASSRKVRTFLTSRDSGTDSDSSWRHAMKMFCRRNNLPYVTVAELRNTGLDIIRDLNNDDIRAVQAAGGQSSQSTIERHYDGAGAKRRRYEKLAEIMPTQERWVTTDGRSDMRGAPDASDAGAATPGWICLDPFDSPIPGESRGRLCQAYGRCPDCAMAALDESSPYALARVLQLAEEMQEAQGYLDAARWHVAYVPALQALKGKWIPLFTDKSVIQAAARMNLSPIGRLE